MHFPATLCPCEASVSGTQPSHRQDFHTSVLFVASATPDHVRVALRGLRASYPDSTFDVISRQEALTATNDDPRCRVIHVTGTAQGRMDLIRRLRQSGYRAIAFVEAGDGGYGALQVLPLFLGVKSVFLVDENGLVSRVRMGAPLTRHIFSRLKEHWQAVLYSARLNALRTFLTPLGLIVLVLRTALLLTRHRQSPVKAI